MALTDVDLRGFLRRFSLAMLWVLLAFSVTLNAFLLVTLNSAPPQPDASDSEEQASSSLLSRWAFGDVRRVFPIEEQVPREGIQVLPVSGYTVPDGLLPPLRDEMPLYRDQGVQTGEGMLSALWQQLGIPFSPEQHSLYPTLLTWKSADHMTQFTLDPVRRVVRISDLRPHPLPFEVQLTEEALIALAEDALKTWNVDRTTLGEPVLKRDDGAADLWVRWPKLWHQAPLLDAQGNAVNGAEVRMDIGSGHIHDVRLVLLSPETLTVSDYPAASRESLVTALQAGGLRPLPRTPENQAKPVSYSSMDLIYILRTGDEQHPTYVVPAVRASWISEQTCADCASVLFSTYVPALSEEKFKWVVSPPES